MLFVDPESRVFYRYYLDGRNYVRVETLENDPKKAIFEERIVKCLYKIRKLLVLKDFSWNFKDANIFRRMPFQAKFLQNECSPYPCYVFQSPLSKAFDSKNVINAEIDVSEFAVNLTDTKIKHSESLVTSTKEFIRNIYRKVKEEKQVTINVRKDWKLILKVDGCREYLEGNYQLLQYERVRLCLRANKPMKLILTQIPINYYSKFPPLFKPNAQSQSSDDKVLLSSHLDKE